jgi:hypothetical protein
MSFELFVEFVGLCLFVPDRERKSLYLLMPGAGQEHGVDPHVARLCFDSAYLQPQSTERNGIPALVAMNRVELSLRAPEPPLALALPDELVDVGAQAQRPVDPGALYRDDPERLLAARVNVGSGGCFTYEPGACWNYPAASAPRRLSNRITWRVGKMEGDRLDLSLAPLAEGPEPPALPPLYPIDGMIELALYYTPRDELPPEPLEPEAPLVGTPAHHFGAFYGLFAPPVTDGPLPTFVDLNCGMHHAGGSPYTCMAAQSPPTPTE